MPSKTLEKYLSNYSGINDVHLGAFRLLKEKYQVERVLYPGSWIHLTPSLVFQFVVYVDFVAGITSMFKDSELLGYIEANSEVNGKPIIKLHKADYRVGIKEDKASFDLLISLSGGFVSIYCGLFLRKMGLLFVNNEHYDACMAYVNPDFLPIGVFASNGKLIDDPQKIEEYFLTNKNQVITFEMVKANSKRAPSKAKYKLKKQARFYLFQKY